MVDCFHHGCCSGLFIMDGSHVSRGVTKTFNYECYLHIWMLFVYLNVVCIYQSECCIHASEAHWPGSAPLHWDVLVTRMGHFPGTQDCRTCRYILYITYTYIHAEYIFSQGYCINAWRRRLCFLSPSVAIQGNEYKRSLLWCVFMYLKSKESSTAKLSLWVC